MRLFLPVKTKVARAAALFGCFFVCQTIPPVHAQSNVTIRVVAANLTSGGQQSYDSPGIRIFQGLKPDIAAIQEFRYGGSTASNELRILVNAAFGTNYSFYREPYTANGDIPNGIVSRYPILASGSWEDSDPNINNRGFAWARIDVPGTNDLFVVSVHLKASNGSSDVTRRTAEANEIKALISTNFPANAWIIVAGDMNIYDQSEGAVATFATFLSDSPVPADQLGDTDTNRNRNERYDRVLMSFSLTNRLVPLIISNSTYNNGLVFDSRVYSPLSDVSPVQFADSEASNMQHMAVARDFRIELSSGGPPALPPVLTNLLFSDGQFQFQLTGSIGSNYIVQATTDLSLANWVSLQTNAAPFTFVETNVLALPQRFYRGRVAP